MIRHIALLLLSSALVVTPIYAEEVYKHIDEDGVPSFSDTKSKDAEKIVVEPVNVQKIPEIGDIPPPVRSSTSESNHQSYRLLEISNPADQSTLRNEPEITVTAAIEPGLRSGHKIEFLNNGQAIRAASEKTSIVLDSFDRGEHQLSVRVINKDGKTLQTSSPITIYVFRTVAKPQPPANPPPVP